MLLYVNSTLTISFLVRQGLLPDVFHVEHMDLLTRQRWNVNRNSHIRGSTFNLSLFNEEHTLVYHFSTAGNRNQLDYL